MEHPLPKIEAYAPMARRKLHFCRNITRFCFLFFSFAAVLMAVILQFGTIDKKDFTEKALKTSFSSPAFPEKETVSVALLETAFPSKGVDRQPVYTTPFEGDYPVALTLYQQEWEQEQKVAAKAIYLVEDIPIPKDTKSIVPMDLSRQSDPFALSNETGYTPDLEGLLARDYPIAPVGAMKNLNTESKPLVLILHTHGTEAFSQEGEISYSPTYNVPRSEDILKNVVAVGTVMADILNQSGIPTLHCEIMHDKESYKDSYLRADESISSYLEQYPSIQYVLDVHRDSLIRSNGDKVKPVAMIKGETVAQVMSVVGTDFKGANHPNWKENLTVAVKLQDIWNRTYPNFARPINLRGASFNEQHTKGSLLLEIGSCGNTLEEAKKAGMYVAESLAKLMKGNA